MNQLTLQNLWRYCAAFVLGILLGYGISSANLSWTSDDAALTGNVGKLQSQTTSQKKDCEEGPKPTTAQLNKLKEDCKPKPKPKPNSEENSLPKVFDRLKRFRGI